MQLDESLGPGKVTQGIWNPSLEPWPRFFWDIFSGPVVGAFPQARVSKMIVVSPRETPEVT